MAINVIREKISQRNTSTSTSTFEIFNYATTSNTVYRVEAKVVAVRTDTSPAKTMRAFVLRASFRNVAGTVTQVDDNGSQTSYDSGPTESGSAIGLPTFFVSGTNVLLLTHQSSTQTIVWDGDIDIQGYTFS